MPTSLMQKGRNRNERRLSLIVLVCGSLLLACIASAQIYLPKAPPEPSLYGKVVLDSHSTTGPGPVVFDHWLHRSKFTCTLCHVDIGFAMKANSTGISARTNREGFHCGACHDGKRVFEGKTVFAACSDAAPDARCDRCHSLGKTGVRKYTYSEFTKKFPKGFYGVNWEVTEQSGIIKPVDFIEGLSATKAPIKQITGGFPPLPFLTKSTPSGPVANSVIRKYSPVPRKAQSTSQCFPILRGDTAAPAMEKSPSLLTTAEAVTPAVPFGLSKRAWEIATA